jgi:hypothetical protein
LNLFAAFDSLTGKVYGLTAPRKRQVVFIASLERLDEEIPEPVTTIHLVLGNLPMHKGKQVRAWLAKHPRFVSHHQPVHWSWMNQVEQRFNIAPRKRLRIADFASKEELAERRTAFIREWNEIARRFSSTSKSMAKGQIDALKPLATAALDFRCLLAGGGTKTRSVSDQPPLHAHCADHRSFVHRDFGPQSATIRSASILAS